jgi:glycerol kinase
MTEKLKYFSKPLNRYFPKPGWVEHDPNEIWSSRLVALQKLSQNWISGKEIAAIGITNQRETTIVWDRETSEPFIQCHCLARSPNSKIL